MRIIAGKNKGIKLNTLEGMNTRPTLDRVKESIFNMIENFMYIEDIENVLDLFSGSGALALECISRYNSNVIMVENNIDASKIIKENVNKIKAENNSEIVLEDAKNYLEKVKNVKKFNLIFLDPPYKIDTKDIIHKILEYNLLDEVRTNSLWNR